MFEFSAPLNWRRTLKYIAKYEVGQPEAVEGASLRQVLADEAGFFLVEVTPAGRCSIRVWQVTGRVSGTREALIRKFVSRTFGDDGTLGAFYRFARERPVLRELTRRYRGLRVVGICDLWECLAWSIIGQQVSVASAFAMRSRLAHRTGAVVLHDGVEYEGFPHPAAILNLSGGALRACGLSRQKSEYLRGIAELIVSRALRETDISGVAFSSARARLLALRGIGPWSAEYCMMRVALDPDACPLTDVGLRNGLVKTHGLRKPISEAGIRRITDGWRPFRGHATFYVWNTLLES